MAYDTIKLKSPPLDRQLVRRIEEQCFRRTGVEMSTGDERYCIFTGELDGSWDSRISVIPKHEDYVLNKSGRPVLCKCEPFLLIEASVHKAFYGHNVYGGSTDFLQVCRDFVALLEELLGVELPHADVWTVHRVDVALVYRLVKAACKEFFDGMQLISFPRRKKGAAKYAMAVYFAGKTTTVKFYHKGSEFAVHERSRLRNFFRRWYKDMYLQVGEKSCVWVTGKDDKTMEIWAEKKLNAFQRLADSRLRVEVEIHSDKLQYDFGKNPRVADLSDAYLQDVYDKEVEKLLREGKQGMDTVKNNLAVLSRLTNVYGSTSGLRLYGFWQTLCTLGDDKARDCFAKVSFWRNRKLLEDAGVSWRGSNLVVVANDSALPHDFAPIRSDKRLCYLPARNREEFQVSREQMRLCA